MDKELAHNFISKTIELHQTLKGGFLELAARLYRIYTEGLWQNGYETYQLFLEDADISQTLDSKLRAVHKRFVLECKMKGEELGTIGYEKLYAMSVKMPENEKLVSFVTKVKDLSTQDFRVLLAENGQEHECKAEEELRFGRCGVCKRLFRIS